eukprot:scaffold1309_cov117-Isochrysis_galbana.AAC.7
MPPCSRTRPAVWTPDLAAARVGCAAAAAPAANQAAVRASREAPEHRACGWPARQHRQQQARPCQSAGETARRPSRQTAAAAAARGAPSAAAEGSPTRRIAPRSPADGKTDPARHGAHSPEVSTGRAGGTTYAAPAGAQLQPLRREGRAAPRLRHGLARGVKLWPSRRPLDPRACGGSRPARPQRPAGLARPCARPRRPTTDAQTARQGGVTARRAARCVRRPTPPLPCELPGRTAATQRRCACASRACSWRRPRPSAPPCAASARGSAPSPPSTSGTAGARLRTPPAGGLSGGRTAMRGSRTSHARRGTAGAGTRGMRPYAAGRAPRAARARCSASDTARGPPASAPPRARSRPVPLPAQRPRAARRRAAQCAARSAALAARLSDRSQAKRTHAPTMRAHRASAWQASAIRAAAASRCCSERKARQAPRAMLRARASANDSARARRDAAAAARERQTLTARRRCNRRLAAHTAWPRPRSARRHSTNRLHPPKPRPTSLRYRDRTARRHAPSAASASADRPRGLGSRHGSGAEPRTRAPLPKRAAAVGVAAGLTRQHQPLLLEPPGRAQGAPPSQPAAAPPEGRIGTGGSRSSRPPLRRACGAPPLAKATGHCGDSLPTLTPPARPAAATATAARRLAHWRSTGARNAASAAQRATVRARRSQPARRCLRPAADATASCQRPTCSRSRVSCSRAATRGTAASRRRRASGSCRQAPITAPNRRDAMKR